MEQLVARRAHNPKVVGSSPAPATQVKEEAFNRKIRGFFSFTLIVFDTKEVHNSVHFKKRDRYTILAL